MKDFFIKLITAHTGISSKRVCGIIGFITIVMQLLYCTVMQIQAHDITEIFIYAVCLLLGIDSVTGIFKQK